MTRSLTFILDLVWNVRMSKTDKIGIPRKDAQLGLLTCSPARCWCTDLMVQLMSFMWLKHRVICIYQRFCETLSIVLALHEHDDWKRGILKLKRTYLVYDSGSHWQCHSWLPFQHFGCISDNQWQFQSFWQSCFWSVAESFLKGGGRRVNLLLASDPWNCIKKNTTSRASPRHSSKWSN